jgi:hypothetical protein
MKDEATAKAETNAAYTAGDYIHARVLYTPALHNTSAYADALALLANPPPTVRCSSVRR